MTAVAPSKPWDLSQVLSLINTLDASPSVSHRAAAIDFAVNGSHSLPNDSPLSPVDLRKSMNSSTDNPEGGISLGNFSRVWEFLGAPFDSPAPKIPQDHVKLEPISPTLQQRVPTKTDYTSDGAVYLTPSKASPAKGIQWRDEVNAGNLIDVAPSVQGETNKLTKTQRKKQNRRERMRLAAENQRTVSDFESEAEDQHYHNTPARKASAHAVVPPSPSAVEKKQLPPDREPASSAARKSSVNSAASIITPVKPARAPDSFFEKRERSRSPTKNAQRSKSHISAMFADAASSTPNPKSFSGPSRHQSQPLLTPTKAPATEGKEHAKKEWPIVDKKATQPTKASPHSPYSSLLPAAVAPVLSTPSKKAGYAIKPKIVRTGDDRNWALLLKLIDNFFEDRGHLVKPATSLNHAKDPKGIHIFVDASNIFIGFHDQLKRARNIPQHCHVPRVGLSFDALALLMERRRPVAKRVLAGSKPNMPAFDTAREIGYECSILDRVLKARELTERQKFFKDQERKKFGRNRSGSTSGDGSGMETTSGPVYAPEALVEQGVDEIIHLKMMESLVDNKEPSTMVLATGDAAQAEYSEGFMRMILRALEAGWKVEIVSWSKNISHAYKKPAFISRWSSQFRIVELDDYAEELLDM